MSESVLPIESEQPEPGLTDRFSAWGDRISDRLNPILVKETRQALKSRQFTITFMLLLVVAWLISVIGAVWAGPDLEFGTAGRGLFAYYYFALVFAVLLVVPFNAFRSMITERDQNTYELLSISSLTPGQIVRGKLSSSMTQVLIYYSAIAPFIAFTSLLQGVDLPLVAFMLIATFLWSTMTCMIALVLSTLSGNRQWQAFNTIGIILLLVWQLGAVLSIGSLIMSESLPIEDPEFWWAVGIWLVAACSYFVLFQQITISRLTFESDNRSTGIRVTCTVQFILAWLVLLLVFAYSGFFGSSKELVEALVIMSSLHCFVVGLFTSTETDFLSRRIRRNLPRSAALRCLFSPLLPGSSRGFLYTLLHLAVIAVISQLALWGLSVQMQERVAVMGIAMPCYCVIYLGFGGAAGRWGRSITPTFRPIHTRVLILLIASLAMLVPYLLITNPFATFDMLYSARRRSQFGPAAIGILQIAACVALIINLRPIWRGITELKRYEPVEPDSTPQTAAADPQTADTA